MISIIDDNDTPPQFSQTSFVKNVGEDLPVGSEILRITVTDPDTTQGTQTLIIANGNYGNYALNSQTGKSTCSVICYSEVKMFFLCKYLPNFKIECPKNNFII